MTGSVGCTRGGDASPASLCITGMYADNFIGDPITRRTNPCGSSPHPGRPMYVCELCALQAPSRTCSSHIEHCIKNKSKSNNTLPQTFVQLPPAALRPLRLHDAHQAGHIWRTRHDFRSLLLQVFGHHRLSMSMYVLQERRRPLAAHHHKHHHRTPNGHG